MDYLRQIEEDLRNISIESKLQKKYPEVCDAVDRALDALKSMREVYVSEIMKKSKTAKLPQSSDVLSPYLLVCNYADGNAKVTLMALNGINLLLTYDLVPLNDAKNIMRALSIQASSKVVDVQLKLLQVVLQLANSLTQTADHATFLTESMFCGFLTLTMQLCDSSSKHNVLSVSSTALGTVRQIIAQVMDGARAQFSSAPSAQSILMEVTVDQASSKYSLTAIMLVREMCLFIQGLPGDWIRGVVLPQLHALDLLTEILCDWRLLFQRVPFFKKLVQDSVFPALRPLMKGLQAEYVHCAQTQGVAIAGAYCSKVVKLARCVLLHFVVESSKCSSNVSIAQVGEQAAGGAGGNLNVEASFIISMLVHTLQPDRAGPPAANVGGALEENTVGSSGTVANGNEGTFKSRWEEASSMFMQTGAGAGMFLTRLTNPSAPSATKAAKITGSSGGSGSAVNSVANGFYLHLPGSGPAGGGSLNVPYNSASAAVLLGGSSAGGTAQLPIFPALCCLEVLLAFFLSDLSPLLVEHCVPNLVGGTVQGAPTTTSPSKVGGVDTSTYSKVGSGLHLFESLLVSTALGVCTFLQSAMSSEANIKELDCSLRSPTPLLKLLKSLLNGSFDHDETPLLSSHSVGSATVDGMVASDNKLTKSLHELIHSMATGSLVSPSTAPADLMVLAFYMMQFVSRLLMTVSMQLGVGTGVLGGGHQKTLRRSFSSSSSGARRLFLSPAIASLVSPRSNAPASAVSVGLVALIRKEPARSLAVSDALGRTCDSVYEACLDACSLLLNATSEPPAVRAALGVMSELAIVSGMLDLPKQCDIVTSVLCKYTVPMWHAPELYSTGTAGDFVGADGEGTTQSGTPRVRREAGLIQWRHYQAFVRLTQVIHLIADTVSDWDNIVDSFEQLVDYFAANNGGSVMSSSSPTQQPGTSGRVDKDAFRPDVDKIFDSIERFKQYSVFLSDDALVRLMTSLVALSMNHLAVNATSMAHLSSSHLDEMDRDRGSGSRSGGAGGDNIIQVSASPFAPATGGVGGSAGPGGSLSGSGNQAVLSRVRPGSSSAGLAYMAEGIRSGTISFSLQALIEITKLNSFRISTIWQMVISHLRMVASLKSANSRAISVAATHDVILSSMRYIQQQQQSATGPSAGILFLKDSLYSVAFGSDAAAGCVASLVMADELMFNFVLPPFESVFLGRDFQRALLEGRDDRLSARPALSQSDLLSSLKALSSVRYSDVRSAIIDGLSQLLQGRGHIISSGVGGGWPVILDIISSVPLSMASVINSGSSSPTPSEQQMQQLQLVYGSEGLETPSTEDGSAIDAAKSGIAAMESEAQSTVPATTPISNRNPSAATAGFVTSGSMASLSGGGVIPQYQWPLESLVSAFNCMKLIVDEFLEVLVPECELVSAVLHGLALFGSQTKDVNISLTSVEMLWKVTDSAIIFARSNEELRLSGNPISSPHYVALVFDIMLKKLFQMSNDGQPLIRHCAMNTLFSAMSTHAPIISTEQWQQVFGNIIFPLFERAGARSRIAMWSKEEAIAPELKKGVKMSVHHSRDTAHKQWSETRVIGLRGLSRVLRTCTRLLLQESWFRVIWAEALSVCQGALQAACDEQEVSIAALDVIFTMLQIIIQTDAIGPAPVSVGVLPEAPTVKRTSTGKSVSTAMEPPSIVLSKDEVENIERCKHTLWQLTWSAVRNTAFFTCNSVELALAISQKLKELYKSRIDREFRYSDNVRVLLEIVVALVRPRVGLLRSSNQLNAANPQPHAEPGTYYPVPDLITQKQDRVAESQLQRAVMDLLSIIQPADGLAQSCLMSTLAEICFSVLWVQVQVSSHSALVVSCDEPDPSYPLSVHSPEPDWLILGAAPERLRKEAAEQLNQLLQLQFGQHQQEGTHDLPACLNKTFPWATGSTHFTALLIDLVVRRFVADICEGPLLARSSNSNNFKQCQQQVSNKAVEADSKQKKIKRTDHESVNRSKSTDGVSGGFLASFSSIMSSFNNPSSGQKLQPVYPKHAVAATGAGPAIASARIAGGTLHKFSKYLAPADAARTVPDCTPSALSITGNTDSLLQRWHNFYMVDLEIRLLLTAVQSCYSLMSMPHQDKTVLHSPTKNAHLDCANSSSVEPVTEVVWNSLLAATACLLSPWKAAELCAKAGTNQVATSTSVGRASREMDVSLAGPAHAIANIIQVSLKIIDFMGYPTAMAVHWVDVLTRSTVLGMHVLSSSGASDAADLCAVGEFYGTLWHQVAMVLGSILAAERDAHQDVRSRALWGALEIAKTAILSVQKSAEKLNGASSLLVSTCDEFLNLLVRTRSTAAMFRTVDQVQREDVKMFGEGDEEDMMVAKWMHSCKLQSTHLSGAGSYQSGETKQKQPVTGGSTSNAVADRTTKKSESTVVPDSSSDQRHLIFILPCCLELILGSCASSELKATAASVVRHVDMTSLARSVHDLNEENERLRERNVELESDILTIKSANTLPF